MESGNSVMFKGNRGTDFYQPFYDTIVNNTGCANAIDTLGCLRALPFNTLNNAINATAVEQEVWEPTIDVCNSLIRLVQSFVLILNIG